MLTDLTAPDVSRETTQRLHGFEALVHKWQPRINLVSPTSLADLRGRHLCDSLQLLDLIPAGARSLVDLGSGGGFPGIPLAIALAEKRPEMRVCLIEADVRKATFLREAARLYCPSITVIAKRIEQAEHATADVLTARALAPLPRLMPMVARHLAQSGCALLHKGATWQKEVEAVSGIWHVQQIVHASRTDPAGVILQIRDLSRVQP